MVLEDGEHLKQNIIGHVDTDASVVRTDLVVPIEGFFPRSAKFIKRLRFLYEA